jgi:hypothetical protein
VSDWLTRNGASPSGKVLAMQLKGKMIREMKDLFGSETTHGSEKTPGPLGYL